MTRESPLLPNKPMVPTATTALAEPARDSGRAQIGQPFGSPEIPTGSRWGDAAVRVDSLSRCVR